mmetsp:Transcript_38253/g.74880  ORF Transcript_38253/g.74880 Transcript_38253/m.74880 type:complete len:90 (+) Transcript_38253:115-384(+)
MECFLSYGTRVLRRIFLVPCRRRSRCIDRENKMYARGSASGVPKTLPIQPRNTGGGRLQKGHDRYNGHAHGRTDGRGSVKPPADDTPDM